MMPRHGLRVLMPSIVDPGIRRGGAWTVTRGLVEWLRREPWQARLTILAPQEARWSGLRQVASVVAAQCTGVPAKVHFLRRRSYRQRIRAELDRGAFDLLVVNGSDLLWCLDDAPRGCRSLAVVHNREARIFGDQVAATFPRAGPVRRWLLRDCARLDAFEVARLRTVDAALFLSDSEAAEFSGRIPGLEHMVLPPQFPEPPQRIGKAPTGHLDLGFLANFSWWPNRDGAQWLVREILDRVPGDVRLHLFGYGSGDVVRAHPRVVAHGFVDDLRDVWAACDWMVVPVRYGAGVSVKAAESLYHGMPLLSTEFGLRGIPAIEHPQVVRRDSAQAWIAFLSGPEARAACGSRLPLEVSRPFELRLNAARLDGFLARVLDASPHGNEPRSVDGASGERTARTRGEPIPEPGKAATREMG